MDQHSAALDAAHRHALDWLASLESRPVPAQASIDQVARALGTELPDNPADPEDVIDLLVEACDPGLTGMPSGRFFGFVIGGTHPAALAADWLVSAWDQNCALRRVTPAHSAVEDVTSAWLLDLLGLPESSAVGFVTGATMANFTGLAAGRDAVLRQAGWDVARHGLGGGPRVRVLVGAERHDTVDLALRYLGLGSPEPVEVDEQGRLRADLLEAALESGSDGPVIVALQAGQRALRCLRPVRRGDQDRARARRVGARRWRVRSLGGRVAGIPAPGGRLRGRGLLGHGRTQDPERAVRQRYRASCATPLRCGRRWGCTAHT